MLKEQVVEKISLHLHGYMNSCEKFKAEVGKCWIILTIAYNLSYCIMMLLTKTLIFLDCLLVCGHIYYGLCGRVTEKLFRPTEMAITSFC